MKLICCLLTATAVFAQTDALPKFEVASVRPSPGSTPEVVNIGVHVDGARVTYNSLTLRDFLRAAYKVKDYQIVAPEWMTSQRFDISATLPAGTKPDQIPEMIKNLLTERFAIKLHHEAKEFPVYALIVAKTGLKIHESAPDPEGTPVAGPVNVTAGGSRNGFNINLGNGSFFNFAANKLEAKKITMPYLAENMARLVDKPVVDMTGLTGQYDILLTFTEEDYTAMLIRAGINAGVPMPPSALRAMEMASGDSLLSAVQAAGLKLDPRKSPLDVIVIDHADKTPTDN